jgi:hypothetical protein
MFLSLGNHFIGPNQGTVFGFDKPKNQHKFTKYWRASALRAQALN